MKILPHLESFRSIKQTAPSNTGKAGRDMKILPYLKSLPSIQSSRRSLLIVGLTLVYVALVGAARLDAQRSRAPSGGQRSPSFGSLQSSAPSPGALAGDYVTRGERALHQAGKLEARLARVNVNKQPKIRARLQETYERAADNFNAAIQFDPQLADAYAGLGAVMLALDHSKDALAVFAAGLRSHPEDDRLFFGWTGSLLALEMVDETQSAYRALSQTRPQRAVALIEQVEIWLAEKQADPGATTAGAIDALAAWLRQTRESE